MTTKNDTAAKLEAEMLTALKPFVGLMVTPWIIREMVDAMRPVVEAARDNRGAVQ